MALDTDLSRKPYFDDYDVTKNFYRVLYRPAAAVQARELNQMQTIMQDQIDKFGRHIFKEGSVIEGCAFTFDNAYNYAKIKDNYANNSAISTVADFVGKIAINTNGLRAGIVNVINGYESSDPDLNTLYLKYLNSTTFANGSQQSAFANGEVIQILNSSSVNIGNVVIATTANSIGKGYAFTTTGGVIFKKGFFIRVQPQLLVVSKYNNEPDNISVGFEANEEIITPEIDTSLLDNAAGSPNYDAPGSHRLKLIPTLVTRASNSISNTSTFFSLCDFKNGLPVSIKNDPQYAMLAKDTARRTYETNGDYIVNPFLLSTSKKFTNNTANSTYNSIVASPGIGYVKGYRVEFINNNTADLRKGIDYETSNNQIVTATFGYYFNATQFAGDFNNKNVTQVELHNEVKTALGKKILSAISYVGTATGYSNSDIITVYSGLLNATANISTNTSGGALTFTVTNSGTFSLNTEDGDVFINIANSSGGLSTGTGATFLATLKGSPGTFLDTPYSANTKIGTAYVRGVANYSGTPGVDAVYSIYVSNISMSPGQKLSNIRSIIYYSGSLKAVADIIPDRDFNGNSIAKVQASDGELMIYPFGQNAIRPEGFSTTAQYLYRNRVNSSFITASGSLSLAIPAVVGTGVEKFNYSGTLSESSKKTFIVIPSANGYSTVKTGNVSINTTSSNVVGTSTTFLSQYQVGDYFYSSANTRRVVSITSDTLMTVDSVFSGTAANLAHQKIWPAGAPINFIPSTRTITITSNTTATVALGEASNADFTASVYFDTLRSSTVPIRKEIKRSTYIKIQANTNAGGTTGPWCLGIPDVVGLNGVYIDETGGTYSNTNLNIAGSFTLRTGQYDSYYDLAYISSKKPIAPNATLLISVDNFVATPSEGVGFFTAASYPIDDVNTSNTNTIRIYQVPQYTSTFGKNIDLRDSIDFRPYAVNTAVANATIATATINPANTLTLSTYGAGGAYLVSPDSNYQSVVQYYLPRKDRISLTTAGQILVTEGQPSLAPESPNELPGTMTIGFANVPPYPSLIPDEAKIYNRYDYSIQTSIFQTKRYTMADINKLSKRIERLEYYTSLSLLEQATNSLTVRSGATGQNRFKNGILVDPFKDHSIGNTNDGTYNISIDRNNAEARPTFNQRMTELWFDSTSSTAVLAGDLILLPYTSNLNQSQQFASKFRSCSESSYNYRGTLELNPVGITNPDILQRPTINGNIDNYTNFVGGGASSRFGTEWGNWTDMGSGKIVGQDSQISLTASSQLSQNFRSTTTTTLAQQQKRVGTSFIVSSTESTVSTGDYVTDVSIQPYVPSRDVFFRAKGMKPNTKLYVFFDNVNVSNYCLNMYPYSGSATKSGGVYKTPAGSYTYIAYDSTVYVHNNDWSGQITSDTFGNVYGVFKIPANVFKSGQLEFKLTDISNLIQGQDAVTTQASYSMFCSTLSVQKERTNLTIRQPAFTTQEVIDTQTIYQNTTDTKEWQVELPPPPIKPDPPICRLPLPNTFVTVTPNTNIVVANSTIICPAPTNNYNNANTNVDDIFILPFPELDREIVTLPVVEDAYIAPEPPKIDTPVITNSVAEPTAPVEIQYRENGDGTNVPFEVQPSYNNDNQYRYVDPDTGFIIATPFDPYTYTLRANGDGTEYLDSVLTYSLRADGKMYGWDGVEYSPRPYDVSKWIWPPGQEGNPFELAPARMEALRAIGLNRDIDRYG
jgi:hypothetical protein